MVIPARPGVMTGTQGRGRPRHTLRLRTVEIAGSLRARRGGPPLR